MTTVPTQHLIQLPTEHMTLESIDFMGVVPGTSANASIGAFVDSLAANIGALKPVADQAMENVGKLASSLAGKAQNLGQGASLPV